jgi:hypothetical protein
MKAGIYFSGILGLLMLVIGFYGKLMQLSADNIFLIAGTILLLLVFVPLLFIEKRNYNRKIDKIIDSYKNAPHKKEEVKNKKKTATGWGMNNSPFRNRKSGLTWGGGNIKGANASRGSRKTFLK